MIIGILSFKTWLELFVLCLRKWNFLQNDRLTGTLFIYLFISSPCLYIEVVHLGQTYVLIYCYYSCYKKCTAPTTTTTTLPHLSPPFPVCFFVAAHHLRLACFIWTVLKNVVLVSTRSCSHTLSSKVCKAASSSLMESGGWDVGNEVYILYSCGKTWT